MRNTPLVSVLFMITLMACTPSLPEPTATVLPSETEIPAETPNRAIISRIDELISGYAEEGEFSGSVLIAEKGSVVLSKGYGFADFDLEIPNTPHTQFSLQSVTKLFTCVAIRMETDKAALTQDDTLAKYIPDYPRGDEITISHLLNHTSGIVDLSNDLEYGDPSYTLDPITIEALIERFKYEALEFDPGTQYDYSNSGYALLAYIIEQTSGMSYNEYIDKEIFTPLKMSDSVADWDKDFSNKALGYYSPVGSSTPRKWPQVHYSNAVGLGNIFSTVEDLYLWYLALHGDEAWRPYDCGSHYGRGHGYQAAFMPIHSSDIVVIMLSNFWDAPLAQMVVNVQEILLEDALVELDTTVLDSYTREYHALLPDGGETSIEIFRVGNHLFLHDVGADLLDFFTLYPLSLQRFILKTESGYGPHFDFQTDDTDKLIRIIIDDEFVIELSLIE